MRDCTFPVYGKQPLSIYALRLLKHIIHEKVFPIKKWSDDGDYIVKHFLSNEQFWKSAAELYSRNLISVNDLNSFKKFYNTHVHHYTIGWYPWEASIMVEPTIAGAWVCHMLNSLDTDEI